MSTREPWHKIQAEVRGRRLALYDDIMNGRPVNLRDLEIQGTLGWLVYHCLVVVEKQNHGELRNEDLRSRTFAQAAEVWRAQGPSKETAARLFLGAPLPVETVAAVTESAREPAEAMTPHRGNGQSRLFDDL
jgi:hypothetical protein